MMQALRCFIVYPTLIPLLLDLIGAARLLKHVSHRSRRAIGKLAVGAAKVVLLVVTRTE